MARRTLQQTLVGLFTLLTLLAVALRAPGGFAIGSVPALASAFVAEHEQEPAVQQAELGRIPVARPAPAPGARGTLRERDASLGALAAPAELTGRRCTAEAQAGHGCSTRGVWSPGPPTCAELMVFLI